MQLEVSTLLSKGHNNVNYEARAISVQRSDPERTAWLSLYVRVSVKFGDISAML